MSGEENEPSGFFSDLRRPSLARDLSIGVAAAVSLIALALATLSFYRRADSMRDRLEERGAQSTQRVAEAIAVPVQEKNKRTVRAIGDTAFNIQGVVGVTVKDARGEIIYHRAEAREAEKLNHTATILDERGIFQGNVRIEFSMAAIEEARIELIRGTAVELILVILVIFIVTHYLVRRLLSRPLRRVRESISRIAEGDYSEPLPPVRQYQINRIIEHVNDMSLQIRYREKVLNIYADSISETNEQLKHEIADRKKAQVELAELNDQLEQRVAERTRQLGQVSEELAKRQWEVAVEVALAQIVQKNLLPADEMRVGNVVVAAALEPMIDLSGDIFEVLSFKHGRVGILVADIMGHGLAAALVSMMVKLSFRTHASSEDPGETLTQMHAELYEPLQSSGGFFFTAFFGVIDEPAGVLRFASGGHGSVCFYQGKERRVQLLESAGPSVGILKKSSYQTENIPFTADDHLVVFSDGLPDAQNKQGQFFEMERVVNLVHEFGDESAPALRDVLMRELKDFRGEKPPTDDVTVLAAKIQPQP